MKRLPVHTIRMGHIRACIWRHKTLHGIYHRVSISKIYKYGDRWRESAQFGANDLGLAAKVLELSQEWIYFHSPEFEQEALA